MASFLGCWVSGEARLLGWGSFDLRAKYRKAVWDVWGSALVMYLDKEAEP